MAKRTFKATLVKPDARGTWTYFVVPFDVKETFGSRAQVKVRGTIHGIPYRGSVAPQGDGSHYMVANKTIRGQAGVEQGDEIEVTMEIDTEPRTVEVPALLRDALKANPPERKKPGSAAPPVRWTC